MIEVSRKGFRIKGLALSPPVVTPTIPQFSLTQKSSGAEPEPSPFDTRVFPSIVNDTNKPKLNLLKTGDLKKLIIQIVTISDGIKSSDVNFLLKEYLKRKKYINAPDLSISSSLNGRLKNLVNEGILTRIRIKEVYYYYRKVD